MLTEIAKDSEAMIWPPRRRDKEEKAEIWKSGTQELETGGNRNVQRPTLNFQPEKKHFD
jgi:hypothetical protein